MFVVVSAAILAAAGSFFLVMWVASKHSELGLATLVASMAFVPMAAQYAWTGAAYDLFYLVWLLGLTACAAIQLLRRARRKRF